MGESVRVRLLLAKFEDDSEPVVVAAIDQTIWEHWEEADESAWIKSAQRLFGADPSDLEWRQVWADFAPDDLVAAFRIQIARGFVKTEGLDA